jgi:ABC-type transporter Mla MlaB component
MATETSLLESQSKTHRLSSLTIADCAVLYEEIKACLALNQDMLLDLSGCDEVDTAGIQFLVAIQMDPVVSLKVKWSKPSHPVLMKAERLGTSSWIHAGALES